MCRCPFHDDHNPSLKLNQNYFYCFGCGATGDVIDLTARLFDLSNYQAVCKLAQDFGITNQSFGPQPSKPRPHVVQFREEELFCRRVLTGYLHLLERWKEQYAPIRDGDPVDDRFVEACQMLDYVEYLVDLLAVGPLEVRAQLVERLLRDGTIAGLQEKQKKEGQDYERFNDCAV
jgi:hypothetical protein